MPRKIGLSTVVGTGKRGRYTYRLREDGSVVREESDQGDVVLEYGLDMSCWARAIRAAVSRLRADGWPVDAENGRDVAGENPQK